MSAHAAGATAGVRAALRASKDAALALAMRRLLNARVIGMAAITGLSLDSARRRLEVRVRLRGERDPITVQVRAYDLQRAGDREWLTLVDAVASRDWVTEALRRFAVGRPFVVPPQAARALRLLA